MDSMSLALCISPCPNDVYIFAGILLGKVTHPKLHFSPTFLDVQAANEVAQTGQFDVIKISYAAYPALSETYDLLPSGGALGRGCGPLLLKNGDTTFDPAQETLSPGAQTTANFLLDFWLAPMKGIAPINGGVLLTASPTRRAQAPMSYEPSKLSMAGTAFVSEARGQKHAPVHRGDSLHGGETKKRYLPFDTLYDELRTVPGTQGVVIHEKRFTYEADGLTLIQDLGEHWENETGYAIPLGAILCRHTLSLSDTIAALIRESLAWADTHRDEALALCREHAQDLTDGVIEAHIGLYVNEYSEDLGKEGRAAVEFFFAQQAAG